MRCYTEDKRIDQNSDKYENTLYYKILLALKALSNQYKEGLILILMETPDGVAHAEYLKNLELHPLSKPDMLLIWGDFRRANSKKYQI
jgi:hypothetical protein